MNFDYKENGKKKLFLEIQSINVIYPNEERMIVMPITEGMGFITSIPACLILWMNFDSKENGGKRSYSCKSKASI